MKDPSNHNLGSRAIDSQSNKECHVKHNDVEEIREYRADESTSLLGSTRDSSNVNGTKIIRDCFHCHKPLSKHFVRALNRKYHLDCFRCYDCNSIVVNKFFPLSISVNQDSADQEEDHKLFPFCENDYFKRLDLLCAKCNNALRGSYVIALNKKYHLDHFTCTTCEVPFGANDSYYDYNGQVYCYKHYSSKFALKCCGCKMSILRQYVEILKNGNKKHWHPECYMIYKFWNITINGKKSSNLKDSNLRTIDNTNQEEKAARIWSVLSVYEESSATCISNFIVQISNKNLIDSIDTSKIFICHISAIFDAIDYLESLVSNLSEDEKLSIGWFKLLSTCERDARTLCRKTLNLFELLADSNHRIGSHSIGITPDLLSLVTGLAHYLKLLIRDSLNAAVIIDEKYINTKALKTYLNLLEQFQKSIKLQVIFDWKKELQKYDHLDSCMICNQLMDETCLSLDSCRRIHYQCLKCHVCQKNLFEKENKIHYDLEAQKIICSEHGSNKPEGVVEEVTRLTQFITLLNTALCRLSEIIQNDLEWNVNSNHQTRDSNLSVEKEQSPKSGSPELKSQERTTYRKSFYSAQQELDRLASPVINASESTQSTTKYDQNDMPAIKNLEKFLSNNLKGTQMNQSSEKQQILESMMYKSSERNLNLDDIPQLLQERQNRLSRPNAYQHLRNFEKRDSDCHLKIKTQVTDNSSKKSEIVPKAIPSQTNIKYFSELSALESITVRYLAVFLMHPILKNKFSMDYLLELVETRRTSFWSRFGKAFKTNNSDKRDIEGKIFGASLESIIERCSIQTDLAISSGNVFIPSFIDEILRCMKSKDLSIEGVFRKNGNIKGLRELAEQMDRDLKSVDFSKENSVQLAALLKRFLRSLPEPLLTYKLHPIWLASSAIEDDAARIRLLHLTCCLLPKCYRDLSEVLFNFFFWVSSFAETGEESGNKMDLHNLATVMAPNLLYKKSCEPGQEESFLAIEAVNTLFEYSQEFCEVPSDIVYMLQDPTIISSITEPSNKSIVKRIEQAMQKYTIDYKSVTNYEKNDPEVEMFLKGDQYKATQRCSTTKSHGCIASKVDTS